MSPAEHYFENSLYYFARTGKVLKEDEGNTSQMTHGEKRAVDDCIIYVLDNLCYWNRSNVNKLLNMSYDQTRTRA